MDHKGQRGTQTREVAFRRIQVVTHEGPRNKDLEEHCAGQDITIGWANFRTHSDSREDKNR